MPVIRFKVRFQAFQIDNSETLIHNPASRQPVRSLQEAGCESLADAKLW